MTYENSYYWCHISDAKPEKPEPDWSKVPEAKREMVRAKWAASQDSNTEAPEPWKLWGPQIEFYQRCGMYKVEVIEIDSPEAHKRWFREMNPIEEE